MSGVDVSRFPLKSVFKKIFQDTSVFFQSCLWCQYLTQRSCGVDLKNIGSKRPNLAKSDHNTSRDLTQDVEALVKFCIRPPEAADTDTRAKYTPPGVERWVWCRYRTKKAISMVRAMIKALWSTSLRTAPGGLRESLTKVTINKRPFYDINPVFQGALRGRAASKEHQVWLGEIDLCFSKFKGLCKLSLPSNDFHGVKDNFEIIAAACQADDTMRHQNEFKVCGGLIDLILTPGKGPNGVSGLFDVFATKMQALLNADPLRKDFMLDKVYTYIQNDTVTFGRQNLFVHGFMFDAEMYKQAFTPEHELEWNGKCFPNLINGLSTLDQSAQIHFSNLLRLSGHPRLFDSFIENVGNGRIIEDVYKNGMLFKTDQDWSMDKQNFDLIRIALRQHNDRMALRDEIIDSPGPSPEPSAGQKRTADEVDYDQPVPIAERPEREPKRTKFAPHTEVSDNSASPVWIIGGGLVLILAFIRS